MESPDLCSFDGIGNLYHNRKPRIFAKVVGCMEYAPFGILRYEQKS
jgi:hypothetical protein